MNNIQIIATDATDYPFSFGQYYDDQCRAWGELRRNYSRIQIQRALVKELDLMSVGAWNAFLRAFDSYQAGELSKEAVTQAQDRAKRIADRYANCSRELRRLEAKGIN